MRLELVKSKLHEALSSLRRNDLYILEKDGSERSIAHCLATYLAVLFPQHDVDCEYNVNIESDSGRKEIDMLRYELEQFNRRIGHRRSFDFEDDTYYSVSVYPDIIVHKRGRNDANLIVLELKKSTTNIGSGFDELKLKRYTVANFPRSLRYTFGVFIDIPTGADHNRSFQVKLFQNGEEIETYTIS